MALCQCRTISFFWQRQARASADFLDGLYLRDARLEKARHDQLLTALRALLLSRKNPFGDIKSDGTVKTALENLGLGEGSALPVGVPVPWPSATPPTGWLKCNGAAFSAEEYPELAKAYPTNKLPDLRGEFIRGWDDGRGIDAGRVLLSIQAGMLEKHRHPVVANDGYDSKEEWELATIFRRAYTQGRGLDAAAAGGSLIPSPTLHSRGSIGNTGGSETRPRNIAFNYIVRAA